MSTVMVEQATKEIGRLLDDLDVIRNGLTSFNVEEWITQGYQPRTIFECVRTLRDRVGYGFVIVDDWYKIMEKDGENENAETGIPDGPPESF